MGSSFQAANTTAKRVYRNILKAVRKHIGKEEHKSHFTDFIKGEFSKNMHSKNLENLKLAHDYTFYLNSVHHHKVLYGKVQSFVREECRLVLVHCVNMMGGIIKVAQVVDRSDEMKKILGKSAASVGLQLPDVYQS